MCNVHQDQQQDLCGRWLHRNGRADVLHGGSIAISASAAAAESPSPAFAAFPAAFAAAIATAAESARPTSAG